MARVAILGGSFDPPQLAHVAIARHVIQQKWADEVWVIPCAGHPFGKNLAPFEDRMAMCRLAFKGIPGVIVNDIEQHLPQPSYTVQTLRHLSEKFHHEWLLVVGADVAAEMSQWKESAALAQLAQLLVIPRGPGSPVPDVSATEVRKRLHQGDDVTSLVPAPVAQYIQSHQLYR